MWFFRNIHNFICRNTSGRDLLQAVNLVPKDFFAVREIVRLIILLELSLRISINTDIRLLIQLILESWESILIYIFLFYFHRRCLYSFYERFARVIQHILYLWISFRQQHFLCIQRILKIVMWYSWLRYSKLRLLN